MNLVHKYRIDIFQDLFVFDALAYPAFKKDNLKSMGWVLYVVSTYSLIHDFSALNLVDFQIITKIGESY